MITRTDSILGVIVAAFVMQTRVSALPSASAFSVLGALLLVWFAGACQRNRDRPFPPEATGSHKVALVQPTPSPWTLLPRPPPRSSALVWFEAEDYETSSFPQQNPFAPANNTEARLLSNGSWIGAADTQAEIFVTYAVQVPQAGSYTFYARKFWKHGPFRWRFAGGKWQQCPADVPLIDAVTLRDSIGVNWVELGSVELKKGQQQLRIELQAQTRAVAFDAFVLARGAFRPRGVLKPDESYPAAEPGWFVFDPEPDESEANRIDLSWLNHRPLSEGQRVSVRGDELVTRDSTRPLRFWGVNASHSLLNSTPNALARYAQGLARKGVNLVRLGGPIHDPGDFRQVDRDKIAKIHLLSRALRAEGIYLGLSIYFPLWLTLQARDGIAGYEGKSPFGLPYFSHEFQGAYKQWWRELLTSVVPGGEDTLARDPTVAFVELINEDSTLFWTFQPYETIPDAQTVILERVFGDWLRMRHGSLAATAKIWGGPSLKGDVPSEGRMGFLPLWNVAHDRSVRARETAEFLARLMRDSYAQWHTFLKNDLGYRGLTICSNWHTADELVLGPLDNWANSVCDIMDRHGYFAGKHEGEGASYSVRPGHQFTDRSVLRMSEQAQRDNGQQEHLPFLEARYNHHPHFVSELGWTWPNRFRTEGPLLTAAYGVLNGLDAAIWNATDETGWAAMLDKFTISDPAILGQFPAAALIFRQGLLRQAESVARLYRSDQELFQLRPARISGVPSLDTLRQTDLPARKQGADHQQSDILDPLSLLVGPVDFTLGGEHSAQSDQITDIGPWLNRDKLTVQSRTQELSWDYGRGVVLLASEHAEGAIGFLRQSGGLSLKHLRVDMQNEYGSLFLVALDGQPLRSSTRLLLQVGTEAKNAGWLSDGDGTGKQTIQAVGYAPIWVREVAGTIGLSWPDAKQFTITALDAEGRPRSEPLTSVTSISLLPDVLYYLIERPRLGDGPGADTKSK